MNKIAHITLLFITAVTFGQSAFYNAGNLEVHGNVQLGFHTDWINDASFEDNGGLIGFYGIDPLQVSGNTEPILNDVEVFVPELLLNTTINMGNNLNFIDGNIVGSFMNLTVYPNFEQEALFTGENDASKVIGFAAISDKSDFSFPVGDQDQLRPLLIDSDANNQLALCAYLFENPSNPISVSEAFDTNSRVNNIGAISANEFWILQTDVPSSITISWNQRSDLNNLANTLEDIILVGWSKSSNQWIAIGNTTISGDLQQGFLISEKFVPNDFAALTFGTNPLPTDTFAVNNPTLGNYFVSPDGDGINDFLVFDNLEDAGENFVIIYNKFGQKVFERSNYTNEFRGVSNINNFVLNREIGLPEGVYYYIVDLPELELQYQGFFFLDR
ncbi:MAG: gliding motility-associated C-terminal domain-containing protein [Bacteroidota bacterium]